MQYLSENKSPLKNRNLNFCCALFPIAVAQCYSELLLRSAFPPFFSWDCFRIAVAQCYFAQPLQSSPPHLRPVSRTREVRYGQPARPNWQLVAQLLRGLEGELLLRTAVAWAKRRTAVAWAR